MVSINYATREVTCKIVYYGPGLSGKTTNLIYVHEKVPSSTKGKMISLATEADRTLYFDFLPINIGQINGFTAKFQLYTVPGQVYYNATRKLVLRGVDGLVFVADSQADKMDENIESLTNLKENLAEYGYDYKEMPIVIQYNKRDLPGVLSVEELEAKLNHDNWKSFEAEAVTGGGVFDTLKMIIKLVLAKAQSSSSSKSKTLNAAPSQPAETPASAQPKAVTPPPHVPPVQQEPAPVQPQLEPMAASAEPSMKPESDTSRIDEPILSPSHETTRQEAYNASIRQEPGLVKLPKDDDSETADTGRVAISNEQQVPVEAGVASSSHRPFPGSATGGLSRRERRITVSDFKPAEKAQSEISNLPQQPAEDKENVVVESNMPKPTMAPSARVIKKKRGFFKRLFGIK